MKEKQLAYLLGMISEKVNHEINHFPTEYEIGFMITQMAEDNEIVSSVLEDYTVDEIVQKWWFVEQWLSE